ncbi:antibiotic biosynthesis monooxygenase family protein [Streptomyces sp. NPDC048603]|uniref:antibiotic biosynthesis monooxygenase family protein n=1 Tax=Streptomyces sp. NPDC048603 TaxID=3365577 RepID=UPI00371CB1F4
MSTDFASIIEYTVDGPDTQRELVDAFVPLLERWVAWYPGYVSARFHVSTDGTRVHNVVTWESEADYRNFVDTSDTEGRLAAIEAAVTGLSGTAEFAGAGVPTYAVVREVGPRARA